MKNQHLSKPNVDRQRKLILVRVYTVAQKQNHSIPTITFSPSCCLSLLVADHSDAVGRPYVRSSSLRARLIAAFLPSSIPRGPRAKFDFHMVFTNDNIMISKVCRFIYDQFDNLSLCTCPCLSIDRGYSSCIAPRYFVQDGARPTCRPDPALECVAEDRISCNHRGRRGCVRR